MKKIILIIIFSLGSFCLFSQNWEIIKEKNTSTERISLQQSDTELCTLAVTSIYVDGILIFYCHAGIKDKEILIDVFEYLENLLDNNTYVDTVSTASSYIRNLMNEEKLHLLKYDPGEPKYVKGIRCQWIHVYCSSYIDKAAKDLLQKLQ